MCAYIEFSLFVIQVITQVPEHWQNIQATRKLQTSINDSFKCLDHKTSVVECNNKKNPGSLG